MKKLFVTFVIIGQCIVQSSCTKDSIKVDSTPPPSSSGTPIAYSWTLNGKSYEVAVANLVAFNLTCVDKLNNSCAFQFSTDGIPPAGTYKAVASAAEFTSAQKEVIVICTRYENKDSSTAYVPTETSNVQLTVKVSASGKIILVTLPDVRVVNINNNKDSTIFKADIRQTNSITL